jgi:predicted RNase H-like HicB family nuclease
MKYRVVLTPDDGKWNVVVPNVKGCHTSGRSLSEARRNALDVIVTCAIRDDLDVKKVEREAELEEEIDLPAKTQRLLDHAKVARAALETAEHVAAAATKAAVDALVAVGLSMRDVADLVGISHQRVQQVKEAEVPKKRPGTSAADMEAMVRWMKSVKPDDGGRI